MRMSSEELYKMYWDEGKSIPKIADLKGHSQATIHRWMERYDIPRRDRSEGISKATRGLKREDAKIKPDLSPSRVLSYLLGVALGDGHVDINKGRFCFKQSVDRKDFTESVVISLRKIGMNPRKRLIRLNNPKHADQEAVESGSIEFAEWFHKLSLKDIEGLVLENKGFTRQFIRGFYESEGGNKRGEMITIINTSLDLICLVRSLLEGLGFRTSFRRETKEGKRDKYCIYVLGGWKERKRFIEEIKPCIKNHIPKRKRRTLVQRARAKLQWSEKEVKYLKDHWSSESALKIARKLQRSKASVYHKASKLGLKLNRSERLTRGKKSLSKRAAEVLLFKKKLADMCKGMTLSEISSKLGVSIGTVHNWVVRHGILRNK